MTSDPNTLIGVAGAAAAVGPTLKVIAEKMLGPIADAVGEHFGQKARRYLQENADAVMHDAAAKVHASGVQPKPIPLRTAIPLLKGASREDDATLRDMWSSLLANASLADADDDVPPSFAHIMGQLSPLDALALAILNAAPSKKVGQTAFAWDDLGDRNRMNAAVDLLQSLGLARRVSPPPQLQKHTRNHMPGKPLTVMPDLLVSKHVDIELTTLGRRFLAACQSPAAKTTAEERQQP